MSLQKVCSCTTLAAMLIFAAAKRPNLCSEASDLARVSAKDLLISGGFHTKTTPSHADTIRIQSKSAKILGAGKLLVASRNLGDPHFAKTVILLVHYDAKGVLGLMLNRRTKVSISQALDSVKAAKDRSDPVYLGGPVQTPAVFALYQTRAKIENAEPVFDSVYLITSKALLEQTFAARPEPGVLHVYLGYAGWNQEQLRKEVELGAWFIFPADVNAVFNANPDSLWQEMIHETELQMARTDPRYSHTLPGEQQDFPAGAWMTKRGLILNGRSGFLSP